MDEIAIKTYMYDFLPKTKNYDYLSGKKIVIAGYRGMIGTALKRYFEIIREDSKINFDLILISRNNVEYDKDTGHGINHFRFVDVTDEEMMKKKINLFNPDFVINLASCTHPKQYAEKPIEVILGNIEGTKNLLNSLIESKGNYIGTSSVEIYGKKNDLYPFSESDYGLVDCNTLRSGYPEAKKVCESLCHAYHEEYGINFNNLRLSRVYGPEMKLDDTKVMSQFILNACQNKDIVLKSEGTQRFSYIHSWDAAISIIYAMKRMENTAYNITNRNCDMSLKEIAEFIADAANVNVVFDLPSEIEKKGCSVMKDAVIDNHKFLAEFGYRPQISLKDNGMMNYILNEVKERLES